MRCNEGRQEVFGQKEERSQMVKASLSSNCRKMKSMSKKRKGQMRISKMRMSKRKGGKSKGRNVSVILVG